MSFDHAGLGERSRYEYGRQGRTLIAEKTNGKWRAFELINRSTYFEAPQRIEAMRALHAHLDAQERQ